MKTIITLFLFAGIASAQVDKKPILLNWEADSSGLNLSGSYLYSDSLHDLGMVVFTIADSTKRVTVEPGWEWVIVVRGGQLWAADSSMREISVPQFPWRKP